MRDERQFDAFVRAGLAQYGVAVDETELRIIRAAELTYGPPRDALLAADLSEIEPEPKLDPSCPPEAAHRSSQRAAP
jgi:hypothetical protein